MVSLSRTYSTRTGGGFFFSNDGSFATEDGEDRVLQPIIGSEELKRFKPLRTIPAIAFELFVIVAIEVMALVMVIAWPVDREKCEPYFILLYIHVLFWSISLVIDQHLKMEHHKLRVNGYLEFYRETHMHFRVPFYVASSWNALLLVVSAILHQQYKNMDQQCDSHDLLSPVNYLCAIITVENIVLAPVIITYMVKVSRFNAGKAPPDVQQEEWMTSFVQNSYGGGEVGYREGEYVEELLEKQADLIRYLKEHNAKLGQKIMYLNSQIRGDREV